jgi:3-hydroxyisobutyrate dehydrogenase
MLALKAGPMMRGDYTTLFKLEHMLKDLRLCLEEAEAVGFKTKFVEETARVLAAADEQGRGEEDFAALVEALQEETGVRL